jgi:hypothetical protein
MPEPRFTSAQADLILTRVYEGMKVYDEIGEKIGTVEYVYPGDLTEAADEHGPALATPSSFEDHQNSLIEDFARDVALSEQVPDPWRERLLHHGFLRINSTGLFTADCYVMPEQIASVSDDHVRLHISRREVIKP